MIKYKEFIGLPAALHLSTHTRSDYLDLALEENWWREFMDERSRTTDDLEHVRDVKIAAERVQEEAEIAGLIVRLHKLADDPKFANAGFQRL